MKKRVITIVARCIVAFWALITLLLFCACSSTHDSSADFETTNSKEEAFAPSNQNDDQQIDTPVTPTIIAGWPPRDFQPVYAEVGLGSGFPLSYLDEAELQTLCDFLQRLEPDLSAEEKTLLPAFRVLYYGPYDTERRGSERILEWYILDDTCSLVRRKGETDLYAVPPDGAVDYVRFLCENTRVIERTADELSSAFESLRAHCLENGTDVRRLWYNAEFSSPYMLWRISRAQYEEGITIAEENYLQLFCDCKRQDATAYEVYSFDLKRESTDSPWEIYPQGIAGTYQNLHSESCIDDHEHSLESTSLCCYSDTGREIRADADGTLTPEQAAEALARMYMDGLCEESDSRTFRITEYKDLAVAVALTTSMDKETRAIYFLSDSEIAENKWVVEIEVQYKYEGIKSPLGPSNGEWIDVLFPGSPVGFLLTREGNGYSLCLRQQ